MADVFISYSRKDSEIVHEIVSELVRDGFDVWIDQDGIESGDAFKHVIVHAIYSCKVLLFFSSAASNASEWTEKEINVAIANHTPIIPIRLDMSKYSPSVCFDLSGLDYIDLTIPEKREGMMMRLKSSLRKKLNHSNAMPVEKKLDSLEIDILSASSLTEDDINTKKRLRRVKGRFSKKYHYIDMSTRRRAFPDRFEECDETFINGFARAKKNGKWGCIDMSGNPVIPFVYDALSGIGTYMVAGRHSREGVIDLHNRIVIPFDYTNDSIGILDDAACAFRIRKDGLSGIFVKDRFVVPCTYDSIRAVCGGVFELRVGEQFTLCDLEGRMTSQPVWPFVNDEKWVYNCEIIDRPILLVGLESGVLPCIDEEGSIKDVDRCGIVGIEGFPTVSTVDRLVVNANGRVFACARNRWGEIRLPVLPSTIDGEWMEKVIREDPERYGSFRRRSLFSPMSLILEDFTDFYLKANLSIRVPFIYESMDELRKNCG